MFAKSRAPRVYLSAYNGSLAHVSTLAHELGHAYHNWVMRDMPLEEAAYPMNLAETASIVRGPPGFRPPAFRPPVGLHYACDARETCAERHKSVSFEHLRQALTRYACFVFPLPPPAVRSSLRRCAHDQRAVEQRKEGLLHLSCLLSLASLSRPFTNIHSPNAVRC